MYVEPEPCGVGDQLVRLADLSFEERRQAVNEILHRGAAGGAKTPAEAQKLLQLIREPGDYGGRIAA